MKNVLYKVRLPFGNAAWIQVSNNHPNFFIAKASLHPDDADSLLMIGTFKECYKALASVVRKETKTIVK